MDAQRLPYLAFLEKVLTPGRLRHSLGVMQVMQELTPIYGLDGEKAALAGLLHDAAKDLPAAPREELIRQGSIPNQAVYERDYLNFQHGPVGAYFVQQELGIRDPILLDAITMHTFWGQGENFNSPLVWCLRFSDLLEPNRNWDERARIFRVRLPHLRELVFQGQMAQAACFHAGLVLRFLAQIGTPPHPNLQREFQERSHQLGWDAAQLEV